MLNSIPREGVRYVKIIEPRVLCHDGYRYTRKTEEKNERDRKGGERRTRPGHLSARFVFLSHRDGLNGLLKPPCLFIYCRYSDFFSFRIPLALLPATFFPFVVPKPPKPIMACMEASPSSSSPWPSTSMSSSYSSWSILLGEGGAFFRLESRSRSRRGEGLLVSVCFVVSD